MDNILIPLLLKTDIGRRFSNQRSFSPQSCVTQSKRKYLVTYGAVVLIPGAALSTKRS